MTIPSRVVERYAASAPPLPPATEVVEDWWEHMTYRSQRDLVRKLRLSTQTINRFNAKDWESVIDYYVQIEMGDPRGWQRTRNIASRNASSLWRPPAVSFNDVKKEVDLYWSPKQQAYDPTMMGNSSATNLEPLIVQSFLFDLANEFYFSSWNQNKAKELQALVEESGIADNVAQRLGQIVFNSAAGSSLPGAYWGERKYYGMVRNLTEALGMVEREVSNYPGLQAVASWLSQHIEDVDRIRETTERMVGRVVVDGLRRLDLDHPSKYGGPERA